MRIIQFPHTTGVVSYPDDVALFGKTKHIPQSGIIVGEYTGSDRSILDYTEEWPVPVQEGAKSYTYAGFIGKLTEGELDSVFTLKRGARGGKMERFLEVIKARDRVDFSVPRTLANIRSLVPTVFADQARVTEITGVPA